MPRPTNRALLLLLAGVLLAATGCTASGEASTSPALRYSLFLAHLVVERGEIQTRVDDLIAAGEGTGIALGEDGIRATAASMFDLVERDRAWLLDNPPAPCYADAHAQAGDVLDAVERVAQVTLGWADAIDTSEVGDAFRAIAPVAADAVSTSEAFQRTLDAVTCLD